MKLARLEVAVVLDVAGHLKVFGECVEMLVM